MVDKDLMRELKELVIIYESLKGGVDDMWQALRELMKDEIDKEIEERVDKEIEKRVDKVLAEKLDADNIKAIRNLMEKVSWTAEKAMDSIGIPESDWDKYKSMLNS